MRLNRKRMVVLIVYILALVYLFSYLPMVKPMSCGCEFRYKGWFWNKGPLLYDLAPADGGKPVQSEWSVDWRRLVPKLLITTIAVLLAFVWIGDESTGWREGIAKVMNRFSLILFSVGAASIIFVLIWAIPPPWDVSQLNQGHPQGSALFFHHPRYLIRSGLHYASLFFSLAVATSLTSLIVAFQRIRLQGLLLCLIALALTLCLSFIIL